MTVIVTDEGFATDDWPDGAVAEGKIIDLDSDARPDDLPHDAAMVRIRFASFSDGRGFTLARQLRLAGYAGRLRAAGHVLADQYAMARRAGFDEVEIDDDLARRQPEEQWLRRADWGRHDHRARLGVRVANRT